MTTMATPSQQLGREPLAKLFEAHPCISASTGTSAYCTLHNSQKECNFHCIGEKQLLCNYLFVVALISVKATDHETVNS